VQVRRVRIEVGLTQAEVADRAGVSVSTVHGLETGRGATVSTLIKVMRACGQTGWLLGLAPDPAFSPIRLADSGQITERQRVRRSRKVESRS
jgi:transcriptional regulator with XRE-family HTH domain